MEASVCVGLPALLTHPSHDLPLLHLRAARCWSVAGRSS